MYTQLVSVSLCPGAVREGLKWADGKLVKGTVDSQVRANVHVVCKFFVARTTAAYLYRFGYSFLQDVHHLTCMCRNSLPTGIIDCCSIF